MGVGRAQGHAERWWQILVKVPLGGLGHCRAEERDFHTQQSPGCYPPAYWPVTTYECHQGA